MIRLLALSIALLGLAAGSSRAETAACTIWVIQGIDDGDDGKPPIVDPQIRTLARYLERAPFIAWREFKLISRKNLTIAVKDSVRFGLPSGHDARMTLVEHTRGPGDHRIRLRVKLDEHDKSVARYHLRTG